MYVSSRKISDGSCLQIVYYHHPYLNPYPSPHPTILLDVWGERNLRRNRTKNQVVPKDGILTMSYNGLLQWNTTGYPEWNPMLCPRVDYPFIHTVSLELSLINIIR